MAAPKGAAFFISDFRITILDLEIRNLKSN